MNSRRPLMQAVPDGDSSNADEKRKVGTFLRFRTGLIKGKYAADKLGLVLVRVITQKDASERVECLKCANYGVTSVDGHSTTGEVKLVFTIVPRQEGDSVIRLISSFDPNAFYSIEEVSMVENRVLPARKTGISSAYRGCLDYFVRATNF